MNGAREPKPFDASAETDKTSSSTDVEHFRHELEFLDKTSGLIDALKKYGKPDRIAYTYDMVGMSRNVYNYPPTLDKYIGEKDFSSIVVTIVKEEEASSTTIEMSGSFGRVHISRDAISPQLTADQIIDDSSQKILEIDRVPDAEINDFLYSMTQRGVDPATIRNTASDGYIERVIGEEMRDALEATALSMSVNCTYELGDDMVVWFSLDGPMDDDKLSSVTLHYRDRDMNDRTVDIAINNGLDIKFKTPGSNNELSDYLYSNRTDYAIALRVIREETAKLMRPTEGKRPFSLQDLPRDLLDEL